MIDNVNDELPHLKSIDALISLTANFVILRMERKPYYYVEGFMYGIENENVFIDILLFSFETANVHLAILPEGN